MTDQMTGHEIVGHENDGHENAGHEIEGHEIEGHKSTLIRKMSKIIASVWYDHPINTFFLNCSISLAFLKINNHLCTVYWVSKLATTKHCTLQCNVVSVNTVFSPLQFHTLPSFFGPSFLRPSFSVNPFPPTQFLLVFVL